MAVNAFLIYTWTSAYISRDNNYKIKIVSRHFLYTILQIILKTMYLFILEFITCNSNQFSIIVILKSFRAKILVGQIIYEWNIYTNIHTVYL